MPPEWAPHARCWLAAPCREDLWGAELAPAKAEFIAFCRALAAHEALAVLVPDAAFGRALVAAIGSPRVEVHVEAYGDIWLRDTGPLFLLPDAAAPGGEQAAGGAQVAACFRFNGWGGRYLYPADVDLSARLAARAGWPTRAHAIVLEGGSVEVDGTGLVLTSRQCLLSPNRNPHLAQAALARQVAEALGASEVLWVGDGLANDHTDGHIDTLARFVGPRHVVCMRPTGPSDPNAEVLHAIERELRALAPADGRPLRVSTLPSPGRVAGADGELLPASYLNFYLGNGVALMPTYDTPHDAAAAAALAPLVAPRVLMPLSARAILSGGGAFHCMSQQEPQAPSTAGVGGRRAP